MRDLSAARSPALVSATTALRVLPPATRYALRGAADVRVAAQEPLGIRVPASACRAVTDGERAALWLGPDEWLLIAPERCAAAIAPALRDALERLPHSLVDVSHRQLALAVTGPGATTLLAAGCPLDLDAGAFPVGMCTRTMLAKAEVVLWRTDPQVFRVEVWRSFVAYVSQFLGEAARGII
jgi:sarcosine oxidase subunit gamma